MASEILAAASDLAEVQLAECPQRLQMPGYAVHHAVRRGTTADPPSHSLPQGPGQVRSATTPARHPSGWKLVVPQRRASTASGSQLINHGFGFCSASYSHDPIRAGSLPSSAR
jgi:hypothetical protein